MKIKTQTKINSYLFLSDLFAAISIVFSVFIIYTALVYLVKMPFDIAEKTFAMPEYLYVFALLLTDIVFYLLYMLFLFMYRRSSDKYYNKTKRFNK